MDDINTDLIAISIGKFFSGELFDLTATSFNNEHGEAHNKAVMTYGISLPITKFKEELQKIAATTSDDKSDKRAIRLSFLTSCEGCLEVTILFTLYCNFLNGGGAGSSKEYWANQQYTNLMVITAAGGNIIILFAQLIVNMIDVFIRMVNTRGSGDDDPDWNWNIKSTNPPYKPSYLPEPGESRGLSYFAYANSMFSIPDPRDLRGNVEYIDILIKTFSLLTPTNQLLLKELAKITGNTEEVLCFIIVKHFIQTNVNNPDDSEILESLNTVATSKISDFDFKLSPNIHPSSREDSSLDSVMASVMATLTTLGLNKEDPTYTIDPDHAGFLLLRVKTLIDSGADFIPMYSASQLKQFQADCASKIGSKAWRLFPQIIQESDLADVPRDSDCYLYLDYLLKKKKAIIKATEQNIDETLKFYMAGKFKQASKEGAMYAEVPPAENSTEAIINYIENTTYFLNIYIGAWETIIATTDDSGKVEYEYKFGPYGAPALNHQAYQGSLPNFSYDSVCSNFKSLNTILYGDNCLVTRLASDIINYFLNSPYFNTENILDLLIESFKEIKRQLTGKESNAKMNPSSLILAPTHRDFNVSLNSIKEVFKDSQHAALGYPDGIRITINAIKSDTGTAETQLDKAENTALEASSAANIDTAIVHLEKNSELGAGIVKNSRFAKIGVQTLRVKKAKKTKKSRKVKKAKKVKGANKVKISRKVKKVKGANKVEKSREAKKTKKIKKVKKIK